MQLHKPSKAHRGWCYKCKATRNGKLHRHTIVSIKPLTLKEFERLFKTDDKWWSDLFETRHGGMYDWLMSQPRHPGRSDTIVMPHIKTAKKS